MAVTHPPTQPSTHPPTRPPSPAEVHPQAIADPTRLGCGRSVEDVWERRHEEPDAHERTCPDCRSARASLVELDRATTDLALSDRADQGLHPDPSVLDRVLYLARTEVRRGRRLPLRRPVPPAPADLTVSEQAVAAVIRRAGDTLPDVETRRCRITLDDGPVGTPHDGSASYSIAVTVSVLAGSDIPSVAGTLRRAAMDELTRELGVGVSRLDVVVEDVHR